MTANLNPSERIDYEFLAEYGATDGSDPLVRRLLGRKWHPLVVRALLAGGSLRFTELKRALGPISGKVLAETLTELGDAGVVDRRVDGDRPISVEYRLTPAGESFRHVFEAVEAWYVAHGRDTAGGPDEGDGERGG
jgi:DNA-binding HxlR family transcriptional regulator